MAPTELSTESTAKPILLVNLFGAEFTCLQLPDSVHLYLDLDGKDIHGFCFCT